jgi:hypothetical protein
MNKTHLFPYINIRMNSLWLYKKSDASPQSCQQPVKSFVHALRLFFAYLECVSTHFKHIRLLRKIWLDFQIVSRTCGTDTPYKTFKRVYIMIIYKDLM